MGVDDYSPDRDTNAGIVPGNLRAESTRDQQIINAIRQLMADLAVVALEGDLGTALQPEDIGVTVQAWNAALDTYAASITAAGLALLDDVSASAQRTTLELGTAATSAASSFASAAQGSTADSALQPAAIGTTVQAFDGDQTVIVNGSSSLFSSNTADRAANQALLVALLALTPTGPIRVEFGTGFFPLEKIPKLSNRHVSITGKGWGQTQLEFTNTATPDIEIEQNSLVYDSEVTGFMFLRSGSTTLSCVSVTRPVEASGGEYRGPNISDNFFHGKDSNTWAVHINMVEGWQYVIQRNQFKGSDTTRVAQAIRLSGASTAGTIRDNRGINLEYGVFSPASSFSEGAYIGNNVFVGVLFGIYMDDGSNAPGGIVIGNHIASMDNAITIIARPQWQICTNLIYRMDGAAAGWLGIYLSAACSDSLVQGNRIISPVASSVITDTGIYIVSVSADCLDNRFRNIYTPINFNDTGTGIIDRNAYTGHTGTAILGAAAAVMGLNGNAVTVDITVPIHIPEYATFYDGTATLGYTWGGGQSGNGSVLSVNGLQFGVPNYIADPTILSVYASRDHIGQFIYMQGAQERQVIPGTGTTYTSTYIQNTAIVASEDLKIGMVIDTQHSPKWSGVITAIDDTLHRATVTAWYLVDGSMTTGTPANAVGAISNPTTKVFGQNIAAWFGLAGDVDGHGIELDMVWWAANPGVYYGFDAVAYGDYQPAIAYAHSARHGGATARFTAGYYAENTLDGGALRAYWSAGGDYVRPLIKSIVEPDTLYTVDAAGKRNADRVEYVKTAVSITVNAISTCIVICTNASGTIDITLPAFGGYNTGRVITVVTLGAGGATVKKPSAVTINTLATGEYQDVLSDGTDWLPIKSGPVV